MAECLGCGRWVAISGDFCGSCSDAENISGLKQRIAELDATIHELEMMIYLYVDGSDIALEHNPTMRRVIENVQQRER